jgi:hypothetical protein
MIRISRRTRMMAALTALFGVALVGFLVRSGATAESPSVTHGGANVVESTNATASDAVIEVGDVTWTLIRGDSPEGACVGVVAEVAGVEQGQVGGSCGEPDDPKLRWGLGGLEVDGRWFNVAYGEVPSDATSVRVTLGDGSALTDSELGRTDGGWLIVVPADPLDKATEISSIEVLSTAGSVIAEKTTPSLVDLRNRAKEERTSHSI